MFLYCFCCRGIEVCLEHPVKVREEKTEKKKWWTWCYSKSSSPLSTGIHLQKVKERGRAAARGILRYHSSIVDVCRQSRWKCITHELYHCCMVFFSWDTVLMWRLSGLFTLPLTNLTSVGTFLFPIITLLLEPLCSPAVL